jgi:hypothetical protein
VRARNSAPLPAATASDAILGTGTVLLGPEAVIIYTPGHWVLGAGQQFMVGRRRSAAQSAHCAC